MKLGRQDVVAPERGAELHIAVAAVGGNICRILRRTVVGVDEVDEAAFGDPMEDRCRTADTDAVPAHVRHLEPLTLFDHPRRKAHHPARDQPQAPVAAEFLALVEEHLHADADAEQRLAGLDMRQQRLDETALAQVMDAVAKGADPRQHHLVRRDDIPGIATYARGKAEGF